MFPLLEEKTIKINVFVYFGCRGCSKLALTALFATEGTEATNMNVWIHYAKKIGLPLCTIHLLKYGHGYIVLLVLLIFLGRLLWFTAGLNSGTGTVTRLHWFQWKNRERYDDIDRYRTITNKSKSKLGHYSDVIMGEMAYQITSNAEMFPLYDVIMGILCVTKQEILYWAISKHTKKSDRRWLMFLPGLSIISLQIPTLCIFLATLSQDERLIFQMRLNQSWR